MERFLFDQFVFNMDDDTFSDTCVALAQMSENIVRRSASSKVTFNYYPQTPKRLQFVIDAEIEEKSVCPYGIKVHHVSEDVWKMKIVNELEGHENTYLATREDGDGLITIRLVNGQVLESAASGDVIEAQVVAFGMGVSIFENEDTYANSIEEAKDGSKYLIGDGTIIPSNFLVNNSAKLTKEEREKRDHSFDNLVDIRGTITNCFKYPLRMFDMDLNSYYIANVATNFGQLKIIIPRPLFPKDVTGFGVGNIIAGKVLISGDVCIYDYEKYASNLK